MPAACLPLRSWTYTTAMAVQLLLSRADPKAWQSQSTRLRGNAGSRKGATLITLGNKKAKGLKGGGGCQQ